MSIGGYQRYDASGVEWLGNIPVHWKVLKVRWIFEIRKRIAGSLGFDVFSITQEGFKIKDILRNEGQVSQDYSKYQLVQVGDFAMNHMDLITGGVDIAQSRGVTSPDYRVFCIHDRDRFHDRYFLYLFRKCLRERIFYPYGQGSSQLGRWRFPTDNFKDFRFPVPTRAEQVSIAQFLDIEVPRLDGLIREQQHLLDLLAEKRQAIISHAVTKGLNADAPMKSSGIEWLGDVPAHWKRTRIKFVSHRITSGPRGWSNVISDEGDLFIQSGNLNDSLDIEFDTASRVVAPDGAEATRCRLHRGDVVVCITGAKTGNVAVCPEPPATAYINQHICLVRPTAEVMPEFMAHYLKGDAGQTHFKISQYGLKQGLSLEDIKDAPIFVPPVSEQQQVVSFIAEQCSRLNELRHQTDVAIQLLEERRLSLVSAAVTGQIDVRGLVEAEVA
jgi:type I restriction enzyme S subunit